MLGRRGGKQVPRESVRACGGRARRTVIVSYSEQSWSQQHAASHSPPVRSHSQICESTPYAGSPISWLPQQESGSPGSSASL